MYKLSKEDDMLIGEVDIAEVPIMKVGLNLCTSLVVVESSIDSIYCLFAHQ